MDILTGIASIGAAVNGVKSVVAGLKSNGQAAAADQHKFQAEMAKASERFIQLRDRNVNGMLDPAEFGGSAKAFTAADKNGDGQLSSTELQQAAMANPGLLTGGSVARTV